MSQVKPIPDGCNTVNAYVVVPNCKEALDFYEKALGGERGLIMEGPGGVTVHAELRVGNSTVMLSDENPQWGNFSAGALGGSPVSLHVYVEDADAVFNQAVAAGAEVIYPLEDTFWGDRYGRLKDPYGITWGIATHTRDLTPEQIAEGQAKFFAAMAEMEKE